MKIINPQQKDITMVRSHSYCIKANYLIGYVCHNSINAILNDSKMGESKKDKAIDDLFKTELMKLKEIGLDRWLYAHKHSMKNVCTYFTKVINTIVPITELQVDNC